MKKIIPALSMIFVFLISGCSNMELSNFSKSMPVKNDVVLDKYLGTWFEFARIETRFEKGMTGTQAKYSLLDPDSKGRTRIKVVNSGFKENGKYTNAKGKAIIPDAAEPARLMVSFFGPFYGDYNIIALDTENYQWALIAGGSTEYLWFLSRTPQMEPAVFAKLNRIAEYYGFNTEELVFPQ